MRTDPYLKHKTQIPEIKATLNNCGRSIFDPCKMGQLEERVNRQLDRYDSYHCK